MFHSAQKVNICQIVSQGGLTGRTMADIRKTQRGERKQAQWIRTFLIPRNLPAICKDYFGPTQRTRVVALKPRTYH